MTLNEIISTLCATYVKDGTAKAENLVCRYMFGDNAYSLWEVYGRWSRAKENAYNYCLDLMRKVNGYSGCVCSHNTCVFTYGFKCDDNEGNTYLVYVTPSYNYIVKY